MAGALESSITLDDVFAMVGTKRVPLAPELAGYLALEIAEGADEGGGDVDPRSVYIAEEGTVALVKRREPMTGDAEASIRATLGRLLDASGSKTAALTAAARRRSTGSLRALAEELEAALIPVNRAAGRRALARLAREVKRVSMRAGRGSVPAIAAPPASSRMPAEEAPTARRELAPEIAQRAVPSEPRGAAPSEGRVPLRPVSIDLEDLEDSRAGKPPQPNELPPTVPPPAPVPLRPPSAGPRPPAYSGSDVDALLADFARSSQRPDQVVARELKAMAGLDPTPPPPSSLDGSRDSSIESLLAMSDPSAPPPHAHAARPPAAEARPDLAATVSAVQDHEDRPAWRGPSSRPPPTPAQAPSSKRVAAARAAAQAADGAAKNQADIPTGTSLRKSNISRISTGGFRRKNKKRGSDLWLIALLFALIGVGVAIVWSLKPGFLTGRTPEKIAQEKAAAEAARQQAILAAQANACKVTLEVADAPTNAEILLREGQAPVDVDRMPVGARLEFVATAEGYAPKRAVVPGGVAWDPGPGNKPRYEVAVQLDKSSGKKADLWPPGEPGSEVGGKGAPGVVHVVAQPRGAEVWLLAGLGPDARIEGLPCEQDVDVLVAGPTTLRKRLHVTASTFTPGPDAPPEGRFAKVSAK